jgi:Protein of unknown function (DUF3300)
LAAWRSSRDAAKEKKKMTDNVAKTMRRLLICAAPLALVAGLAGTPARAQDAAMPAQSQSQTQNEQFSQGQIAQLVAPIALYPDSLLSQILMASTYPLEVVEAARWSQEYPNASGQALQDAMQSQSWDPSVKALTAVPQTLAMMSDKLNWTEQLGDAFLAQQQDVLEAVQKLRAEAQAAGNLQSTSQQVVTTASAPDNGVASSAQQPIVIESANPDVYYVPVYNPAVAYGAWDYPAYPPFYWSPPGFVASNVVSFAAGVAVGAAIWGGCDWWHHSVIINVNRYNVFNRTNINITNNVWVHNPAHRGDVPYRNPALAARFGRTNEVAARDAFRDRMDAQHGDVFRDRVDDQRPDAFRDRVDTQRPDEFRKGEGDGDAARRVAPDMADRRDGDDFRRDDGGDRRVDRAMPEHRDFAPPRDEAAREDMRPRAQDFRPDRGGEFRGRDDGRRRF